MRVAMAVLCVFALSTVSAALADDPASAEESKAIELAEAAAKSWLALVDASQYGQSWDTSAKLFQGAVAKGDWERALKGTRTPLGTVRNRKLKSAAFKRTLPGAPDGEYVVIQYETEFENKARAIETVTPQLQADGSWKVSGYFIR